jgi:hypothetical protein
MLTGPNEPRSRSTTSQKIWYCQESNPELANIDGPDITNVSAGVMTFIIILRF